MQLDNLPPGAIRKRKLTVLIEDGERTVYRGWREPGIPDPLLAVVPTAPQPGRAILDRLEHEYALAEDLDSAWALRPRALIRDGARTALLLEDPGGVPLESLLGAPMELGQFLRLAIGVAAVLGKVHQRGLVHREIKPANILVKGGGEEVRLTGFGIASRLPRERQSPEPPKSIAGTLAYMAPEQTGRMNRSIDSRSDLYALGVTLYQTLTGSLPFTATDPMEWVHCHIARKPVPPSERLENIPAPVSAIIMRLLAKTAEDRYQTAGGVERDLRRCLAAWEVERRIDEFPLGEHDMPDRLFVPEKLYGREREVETLCAPGPTGTIEAPVEHLDLATVIKVSQAVSGEMVQEKQLEILMRTAIEQAGAERGVLVLSRWTEPRIAAQATTGDGGIVVKLHDEPMTPAVLPESVIQYVVRTNESVILDDAAAQNPFSADPYIRQQHARSILCLPFLNQGQLIGVLYLENNLTPGVFAPARIAVLKLLASQAAISLENARLHRDLAEREAKIRRLVEAQTPQAEDELRAIIDNAPVFLWSDLPDGYCDFLNQPWLTYFNLSLQEAQGAGWATVLHPDDAAHQLERWQKSVSTGIPFETEARFRRSDGEYRWFLTRANPLRDKTGRIVKWYGTNIDIENLKRTEGRLRKSEAYLAEAQRLSHTGSFGWTPSTGEIHWSEESFRIFEYDRSIQPTIELVLQRIHPDDRAMMRQLFDETSRGEKDFDVTHRLLMPDGSAKFVHILSHAVKDAAGNLEIVGTLMDVTESTRLYRDLAEREAKIRRLVDANVVGVMIWELEGRILEANDAFLRIVGYERADVVSGRLRWTDLTPPEWVDRDLELHMPALKRTEKLQPFEKEYFHKDGHRVPVLIGGAAFDAECKRGVAFVVDLTERKCAEEELRRSQHYLAEAQKVSHTGSWAWSPVSNAILYWSEECYRILGYDPAQGLPSFESSFERINPEDRPALAETIERAVREKADFQIEYRLVLPDGTRRNVRILSHPVLDASGKLVEFVGTVMDVTEQKRASQERRAHLWFLESVNRINRAMQRSNDVELMTSGVMQEALEIFACDRVALIYPCDPDAPTYRTVMEHTSPEYKGALTLGKDLPVSPEGAELHRRCLQDPGAVVDPSLTPETRERFRIASMLAIAVRPKGDRPYMLGVHCERSRSWTAAELRLFEEVARRLGDALTSVLAHRNLLAREEELRRSQHYLAEAQRLSHIGSWAFNAAGFGHWSPELFKIHGLDPGGKAPSIPDYLALVHPEDRDFVVQEIQKLLAGAEGFDFTKRIVRPDGAIRHVRCIGRQATTGGVVPEFVGMGMDVTEQERAEEERRAHLWFLESMDRINRAMQRTNDVEGMMSGVLEETLAIFGSDRAWLVYPCDPDAATSRVVMEHTRPEYPGAFGLGEEFPVNTQAAEALRRVLEGPGAATDLSISPELRERFSIQSVIAIAVRPKRDRPYLFGLHQCSHARAWSAAECRLFEEIARRLEDALTSVLAHRNLLAREEELRRSRAYLAEAQKVSHTGSWAWNNVREIVYWSEECFRIHGRDPAQGLPSMEQILADIHPDDVPGIVASLENALREGRGWELEYRMVNFADGPRTIRTIAHPVLDRSGRAVEHIGTVVDVTEQTRAEAERVKLEERLRQAEKMQAIGTLAGGIAHDFNNILGAILGYGELAQRRAGESGPLREQLDQVMQAGNRGKRLVEHILAFSRSGVGERLPVHVQAVVEETLDLLAASLPPTIRLKKMLRGADAAVVGDATQLHQVTMNLCTNAVQAMPNGGVLSVTLERTDIDEARELAHGTLAPGPYIRLQVTDTGSGIPPAALERIFDPFFTTKRVGEGTGLGLSLVHGIVADSGGAVDVESREGAGTTFTVWLPASGEAPARVVDAAGVLPHGNGEAVMIVDDERPLVSIAEEMLAGLGYEPVGFSSSAEALAAFRAEPDRYDIVLTDETMPDMTGTELASEIRRLRADIPIVLMSGYSGPEFTERARAAGVSDILRKPLVSRDIAEALARVIPARA